MNEVSVGASSSGLGSDLTALKATIQRQADQIESLHAAAQKYKSRNNALEQQLTVKQAELDSLRLLSTENAALREDMFAVNERNRELEQALSRLTEQSTLGAESQAQLGVKVQAYQRHNTFLQGELATAESKLATARERIDVLQNELRHRDARVSILIEKLRQHNIDPSANSSRIQITEEGYREMKDKIASQNTSLELLREKVESMQEEAVRREEIMTSLRRENDALKGTISRLIALTSGVEVPAATGGNGNGNSSPGKYGDSVTERLAAFRKHKARSTSADNAASP
jgi:chromosome segregation ATPase